MNNIKYYFFKGDSGEYGFSNDQFITKNDSILFARNFFEKIETPGKKRKLKRVFYK